MWIAKGTPFVTCHSAIQFSISLVLFTHTGRGHESASALHPLINVFRLQSRVIWRTGKEFRVPTGSIHLLQNGALENAYRKSLEVPIAGVHHSAAACGHGPDLVGKGGDAVAYCLKNQDSSLHRRLMTGYSDFILYDTANTHSELKIVTQKHQYHPVTSAASGSTWSQSVFFSLVSWTKPIESLIKESLPQPKHRDMEGTASFPPFNLTFQKCAEVSRRNESQIVTVKLIITSMDVQSTYNLSQLTIRDAISGLSIQSNMGKETELGFQTYYKDILQAGEYYVINYTAILNTDGSKDWRNISLPAYLNFGKMSQIFPDHGIHFLGFIVAFIVSFALVCLILIIFKRIRNPPQQQMEKEQSHSSYTLIGDAAERFKENLQIEDKVIGIWLFEDPENMTQAFNDLHILSSIQMDTDLEYCRKQMHIDAIVLLLRTLKPKEVLSPSLEERFSSVFRRQFEEMEARLWIEYDGVLAAIAAQSNEETGEKLETLNMRQREEEEETELLIQKMDEELALQCRKQLEQLHTCEQKQLKDSLQMTHEEASGKARRKLVVCLRQAFQAIIFDQLKEVIRHEELDAASAGQLLQANWHIQFQLETLMDQQLAFQRKVLDEGLAKRKSLVNRIKRGANHSRNLLNTASLHISAFADLLKNTTNLTEGQLESVLDIVHQEILVMKLKLDEVMDQEKKLIHCKLISERREHIFKKICEQEHQQRQLASLLSTSGERHFNHRKYLMDWHELLHNQCAELGELVEKLDKEAVDQLETLNMQLLKNASMKIKTIHAEFYEKLVSLGVPQDYLRQMIEDQDEEINIQHEKQTEQAEIDEHKENESLENVRGKISKQLHSEIEEQNFLRHWNELIFQNLMKSPLLLSEDEFQKMMLTYLENFCKMDNSLSLPKLCERSRIQQRLTDWRKTETEKLEQQWKNWGKVKTKEVGHGDQGKLLALQEYMRDKIKLYEEENDKVYEEMNMVHAELLQQRANQMKDLEESLGVCMASIQLCRAEKQVSVLEIHTAVLNLQALLLDELSTAGSVPQSECAQIVQEHIYKLEQLACLHSEMLQHQLAMQSELTEQNSWMLTQSRHPIEDDTAQSSSQVFNCLQRAMFKYQELIEAETQRLRNEDRKSQLIEDAKGQLLVKTLLSLQDQEMRLAAYLTEQLEVPMSEFQALLNLILPNATNEESSLIVNGMYSERIIVSKINENKTDEKGKRRLQRSKKSLDQKLRNKLIGEYQENIHNPCSKKRSILKKKGLQLMKQVSFSPDRGSPEFCPAKADDHHEPIDEALGQALNMPETGEKVFVFRIKEKVHCCSDLQPKKKKKRNFLNYKRAAVANLDGL
ncbi:limbin isoform X2 [Rhincodon typus]|uniref:limbin isoform X2 n=1 Tax=Rhincodon typus TaxID=259920 RepID=UPI002030E03A|nr:limbin isoform X2 [Rhincodon typus]